MPNAAVARQWSRYPFGNVEENVDITATLENIEQAAARVNRGDFGHAEAPLTAQTVTLNALFTCLAQASAYIDHFDRYLRLALKAQSQCRTTFEALALLKNPPVFARQANIASQQVVNDGTMVAGSRAGDSSTAQNGLLEAHGERLDGGETDGASGRDTALAPVGTLRRASDRRW